MAKGKAAAVTTRSAAEAPWNRKYPAGFEASGEVCVLGAEVLEGACRPGRDYAAKTYPDLCQPGMYRTFLELIDGKEQYIDRCAQRVFFRHPERCLMFLTEVFHARWRAIKSYAQELQSFIIALGTLRGNYLRAVGRERLYENQIEGDRQKLVRLLERVDAPGSLFCTSWSFHNLLAPNAEATTTCATVAEGVNALEGIAIRYGVECPFWLYKLSRVYTPAIDIALYWPRVLRRGIPVAKRDRDDEWIALGTLFGGCAEALMHIYHGNAPGTEGLWLREIFRRNFGPTPSRDQCDS